jgi:D-alanyl-D-alanine carboxypeptidase/D-alanyl-D-alanine-endopeptidase (penicillin-binding protein 4)
MLRTGFMLTFVAALCGTAIPALAQGLQGRVENIVRAANLGGATVSIYFEDPAGGELVSVKSDRLMIPASNMKLVTTTAALHALGPDFQFTTRLLRSDDMLIIVGDGDPAFGDPELLAEHGLTIEDLLALWVEQVVRSDMGEVSAIVIDDRLFDTQFVHPNWPTEQLDNWYCAQVAALNFNDNCLDIYARPTEKGQAPRARYSPLLPPVAITNRARTGSRNAFWASREPDSNNITLRGQVKHRLHEPISITINDPPLFFGQVFKQRLQTAGVNVGEVRRIRDDEQVTGATLLAAVKTDLAAVLRRCNTNSQNLFAEALLKRLGHEQTGEPGGWANGAAAVRMYLAQAIGPDASSIVIDDGSGLSRQNRIATRQLVRLLSHVHDREDIGPALIESMAVAGKDGTLARRFASTSLEGTVYAKSGYIRGVVALSGYLVHEQHTSAFSVIFNDFTRPVHHGKHVIDLIVAEVDRYLAKLPQPGSQLQIGG